MRILKNAVLALAVLVSFAGCATTGSNMVSKDTKMKCPKCGAVFTVDEGMKALSGP